MNQNAAASYTEPYRTYTRNGDNLEQIMIDAISAARSTVDVAVQELRLPGIAQALVDRHRAGVRVRVILENTYSRPYSQFTAEEVARLPERERDRYQEARRLIDLSNDEQLSQDEINQRDALVILDNAQIPRIDDTADGSAGSNLMHHKFIVVDRQTVIVSSANLTTSDVHGDFKSQHSRGNANNLLKIANSELATLFTQEFNVMWGDGPGANPDSLFGVKKPFQPARQVMVGTTPVEVQFSPTPGSIAWEQSSNGLIGKTLDSSTQSVQMALFVFSDQRLVNLLESVHQRGVAIQTLIDPGFAYRSYSEALDMLGISLAENCKLEANNRPWKNAIATVGVPRMPPGDLLHHKFGLVDRQTVVTGSHNWTDAANTGNDETVLVIRNSTVAAHYYREFERLYTGAVLGIPPAIQKKASRFNQQCQTALASVTQPSPTKNSRSSVASPVLASSQELLEVSKAPARARLTSKSARSQDKRINLNTATQAELEQLPGVGPALAKRIIAARQLKRFSSLADLDKVSGIGPKLLQKLENQVEW
ncbi:MAG: helix-hairpin-helix domain-containing protein [Oscillatoriales cyanobacterium C42_A2020_001]|nr:helix-hairpin-helix domain-containing protein [Leptolyngbyaceae cyanobacterium C42_A2020_001]